ncbi:class I SAM-dependent methyltransferase [Pyxidicoccus parkwayensis]|uniref:Class I SAM-dependent methyltransferase n=1 Tax=Pyxidicoccus parkwayensis TaxID=2813578 RepID=A0ABX7NS64_9BACT|nr:class I SAM-dependent methyltransferase [Pyxidicoccus parkwaysis]QSQ21543.1 class I SAM-dependent methyltransferase [Pyxidicoccus parkwaysis]
MAPVKPTHDSQDDFAVSFPRLLVIRVWSMFLELLTRLGDLAVLLLRPRLLLPYLGLWLREALVSPYRLRRSFELTRLLQASRQNFNELMYGETPVHTALWLFHKAGLNRDGHLVDLGAGRGRTLIAARWLGASARGIELLPGHVALASGPLARAGAQLVTGDATQADISDATHVFTNWTALTPETRARLIERLRTCRPGTRVLTVTRPVESKGFTVLSRHRLLFTWGLEDVWIHEYRG